MNFTKLVALSVISASIAELLVDELEKIANLNEKQIFSTERLATIDEIYHLRAFVQKLNKQIEYFQALQNLSPADAAARSSHSE